MVPMPCGEAILKCTILDGPWEEIWQFDIFWGTNLSPHDDARTARQWVNLYLRPAKVSGQAHDAKKSAWNWKRNLVVDTCLCSLSVYHLLTRPPCGNEVRCTRALFQQAFPEKASCDRESSALQASCIVVPSNTFEMKQSNQTCWRHRQNWQFYQEATLDLRKHPRTKTKLFGKRLVVGKADLKRSSCQNWYLTGWCTSWTVITKLRRGWSEIMRGAPFLRNSSGR